MGDRIVIRITDGTDFTPEFYGHWCGLRAVKVLNDLVRKEEHNGIHSLLCNFIVSVMEGREHPYSFYLYNHGEAERSADWDNYTWTFNTQTMTWTATVPELKGRNLTIDESDDYVRRERPCLYRTCKCDEYGGPNCLLKFQENCEGARQ